MKQAFSFREGIYHGRSTGISTRCAANKCPISSAYTVVIKYSALAVALLDSIIVLVNLVNCGRWLLILSLCQLRKGGKRREKKPNYPLMTMTQLYIIFYTLLDSLPCETFFRYSASTPSFWKCCSCLWCSGSMQLETTIVLWCLVANLHIITNYCLPYFKHNIYFLTLFTRLLLPLIVIKNPFWKLGG